MATSLGLNERLFVVNPQEVHELVGTGRGPGRSWVLGVAGEGHKEGRRSPGFDCCWVLRMKWKEWASADGRFQKLGKGDCWLRALKEKEDLLPLEIPQEIGALLRGVSALGSWQEDRRLLGKLYPSEAYSW